MFFINTEFSGSDSLKSGSIIETTDFNLYSSGSITDQNFGKSFRDRLDVFVLDSNGNRIFQSEYQPKQNVASYDSAFYDLNDTFHKVKIEIKKPNFPISFKRNILLNVPEILSDIGYTNGAGRMMVAFARDLVGSSTNPIVLKQISSDRKELIFSLVGQNQNSINTAAKKICVFEVFENLLQSIEKYQVGNVTIVQSDIDVFQKTVGLSRQSELIQFFYETYFGFSKTVESSTGISSTNQFTGIKGYIRNFLEENYYNAYTYEDFITAIDTIVKDSISKRISGINSHFVDGGLEIVDLIFTKLYNSSIRNEIETSLKQFVSDYFLPFSSNINFGNGNVYAILNQYTINDELVVKIADQLPDVFDVKSKAWVTAFLKTIYYFDFEKTVVSTSNTIKLSDINFSAKERQSQDFVFTEYSGSNKNAIDYSEWENFVIFSSINTRLKIFKNKLNEISTNNTKITTNNLAASSATTIVSASFISENETLQNKTTGIITAFDGYEEYLYDLHLTGGLEVNPTLDSLISSSLEYDHNNPDALVNNLPQYILQNDDNSDFVKFVAMIGHFFDNIFEEINANENSNKIEYKKVEEISFGTQEILESLGFDASIFTISTENLHKDANNRYDSDELKNLIKNRIMNNFPELLKSKGTSKAVQELQSIYAIPDNVLDIIEYKVIENGKSIRKTQDTLNMPRVEVDEYFRIPIYGNTKTIEFSFKSDGKELETNKDYLVFAKTYNTKLYITKLLDDMSANIRIDVDGTSSEIENVKILDGNVYTVTLQSKEIPFELQTTGSPKIIKLQVERADSGDIVFSQTASFIASPSIYGKFESEGVALIGNFFSQSFSESVGFKGNFSNIKIYSNELSSSVLSNHAKNIKSIDYGGDTLHENLLFYVDFSEPVDLYGNYTSSDIGSTDYFQSYLNRNKYYTSSFTAHNFKQSPLEDDCYVGNLWTSSAFPYQFEQVVKEQTYDLSIPINFNVSDFIKKSTQRNSGFLKVNEMSTSEEDSIIDTPIAGVVLNPFKFNDRNNLNLISERDLNSIVGSPENQKKARYYDIDSLRNKKAYTTFSNINRYQEFVQILQNYVDGGFFASVKHILPAQTKDISGLLIKPLELVRDKYQHKDRTATVGNYFDEKNIKPTISSEKYEQKSASVEMLNYDNTNHSPVNYSPSYMISDDGCQFIKNNLINTPALSFVYLQEKLSSVKQEGKSYLYKLVVVPVQETILINGQELVRTYYKEFPYAFYELSSVNADGTVTRAKKLQVPDLSFKNFVTLQCNYYKHHKSLDRNALRQHNYAGVINQGTGRFYKKGKQTAESTVNSVGQLDGSSPIESIIVTRNQTNLI